MRTLARFLATAALLAACSNAPSAPPAGSNGPAASSVAAGTNGPTALPAGSPGPGIGGGPPSGPPSSQQLIAADRAAGSITEAQSVLYRAWAAFGDPRLPER